jgi:HAMP domain-containing protein
VTRVAREVGTEGVLGGQAEVPGVGGTWKDLTDNVNQHGRQPDRQVRDIADVTTPSPTATCPQDHRGRAGEILELKDTINSMVDQLRLRGRGDARGARGRHRGRARRPGEVPERGGHVEGPDRQRELHGRQPDRAGAQHRRRHHGGGPRRPVAQDHGGRAKGEILELKDTINTMVDQLGAFASEVTRVAREVGTEGVLGGQANVPGVAARGRT